jgi:hypothetical protein
MESVTKMPPPAMVTTMQRTMRAFCTSLLALLPACGGGGGGGGSTPTAVPNRSPILQHPPSLIGSGANFQFSLPFASTQTLDFSAVDPDGDPLHWQVLGAAGAVAVGCQFPTVTSGANFRVTVTGVAAPAAAPFLILVEDSTGRATAIDLLVVRTGAPSITAITPDSAFRSKEQEVTITGSGLSLGGTTSTTPRFAGLAGTGLTVLDDATLRCTTPPGLLAGPTQVSVTNVHGTAALSTDAFTAYSFPPQFAAADTALDGGAGQSLVMAQDGRDVHAVWIEGTSLGHRSSLDGGATWSATRTLNGGDVPLEAQVHVQGQQATIVWVGDGASVLSRTTTDGGASFSPAVILNPAAGTTPAQKLQLCGSGSDLCAVWLAGDPLFGAARVTLCTSADAGLTWSGPFGLANSTTNQASPSLACEGSNVCLAFADDRQAGIRGIYSARSTNGGVTWNVPTRRSATGIVTSEPRLAISANRVHLTWLQSGGLRYAVSEDGGATWPSSPGELQSNATGTITEPAIACEGSHFFATYVVGGNSVWVSRVTGPGAIAQQQAINNVTVLATTPRIACVGNYVFTAWQSDAVGTGAARIATSVSTDLGQTFTAPAGLGDGTAAQETPQMLVHGARVLLAWNDHRGAQPALFLNRNEP